MTRLVITIDGPAASGKSTVARLLAEKLNAAFLDTGAMYRAATLAAIGKGADLTDHRQLIEILNNTNFEFTSSKNGMLVKINSVDVTEKIRTPQVTANARYVAGCPQARQRLVEMQRQFADANSRVVSEGRDQGTVAFPDADLKFYLTADLDERARRRHAELKANGVEQTIEQIRDAIRRRDDSDEKRFVGPLKPAADAIIIDTTNLTIEMVIDKLVNTVKDNVKDTG